MKKIFKKLNEMSSIERNVLDVCLVGISFGVGMVVAAKAIRGGVR